MAGWQPAETASAVGESQESIMSSYSSRIHHNHARASCAALAINAATQDGDFRDHVGQSMVAQGLIPKYNSGKWPNVNECIMIKVSYLTKRNGTTHLMNNAEFMLAPSSASGGTFRHRLFVRCPDCMENIPTGRFHQHVGSKPCVELSKLESTKMRKAQSK